MTALGFFLILLEIFVFTGCAVFMVRMLPRKTEKNQWAEITAWGIFALLSVLLPNIGRDDVLTMAALTPYYLGIGWFLYHRSRTGLLYQLIYMVSMYIVQIIAIFCAIHFFSFFHLEADTYTYVAGLLKQFFLILSTMVLGKILNRRYMEDGRRLKMRGMMLVPLFSIALIFLHLVSGEVFFIRYGYGLLIVFSCMLLVINFYCLYFWYDVAANQELKHKVEMMENQNSLTHQYYMDLEENYSQSRKIIHDIRNHMYAMEQAIRLEQTQGYFTDMHTMLNSLGLKFYSDNRMLNIVLNDKLKDLPEEQAECMLGGIDMGFLSEMDITTIFSNLLDNALEAGKGRQDFRLWIRGDKIQDFTVIKIWNTLPHGSAPKKCPEEDTVPCIPAQTCTEKYPDNTGKKSGTCKPKTAHEGLGLENVKQALKKYHGELEVSRDKTIFSVTVMFPGQPAACGNNNKERL